VEKLPLAAIAAADCLATLMTHASHPNAASLPWADRLRTAIVAPVTYLFQFFYPAKLAAFYPFPRGGYPTWQVTGAAAVLGVLTAAAVLARRRSPYGLVGWFWYLGMLTPVLGLVTVSEHATADRYTYLPSVGLCIAVVWPLARLAAAWHVPRWLAGSCAGLVAGVLMSLAYWQTSYWSDGLALWRHALAVTHDNAEAEGNLGFALANADEKGRWLDEAIDHYRRAESLRNESHMRADPILCNNFGVALGRQGKFDEAKEQFRTALEVDPKNADAHVNLGTALANQGHAKEAGEEYLLAIEYNKFSSFAHVKMAQLLAQQGEIDLAIAYYREALRLAPGDAKSRQALDKLLDVRSHGRSL
jgi:protein O-mannosyl-transferase